METVATETVAMETVATETVATETVEEVEEVRLFCLDCCLLS